MQGDSSARITFTGYRSDIDKFFNERMIDPSCPCLLKQKTPMRLLSIVEWLSGSKKKGRSEVASFILDLSGPARSQLANGIEEDLAAQSSTPARPRALSIHGESNL